MKAKVSLSCLPTLFIARPEIHSWTTSQIQSPDFRSSGWKMSCIYICMWTHDYMKFTDPKVFYISNRFPCSKPLAKSCIHSKSRADLCSLAMCPWREPCAWLWSCWAGLQQRFGNLSTGGSLDGQFLSEAITANGIFPLCLVSSPNTCLENDQN